MTDAVWFISWDVVESLTGETLVLAVLTSIQLSMVVMLLRQGRKDRNFRQAFFLLFVAVTIVDCVGVVVVSLAKREALYVQARLGSNKHFLPILPMLA